MSKLFGFEPTHHTPAPQQTEGWIDFRYPPEKAF